MDIAALSHHIDTSELSPNVLRGWVREFVQVPTAGLTLLFQSFAYKHGIPLDTDMVFDVRCLPNPHWDPRLRPLSGRDAEVREYFSGQTEVGEYLAQTAAFLDHWLPSFERGTRSYVTVAFGCTGGRHRSVYCAEWLANYWRDQGRSGVVAFHRELG